MAHWSTNPQSIDVAVVPLQTTVQGIAVTLSGSSNASADNVPAGVYEVVLVGTTGLCWIAWAASVTAPSAGHLSAAGTMLVRDGQMVVAPGGTAIAALVSTGTGTLGLQQIWPDGTGF